MVIITFNTPTAAMISAAGINSHTTELVPVAEIIMIKIYPVTAIPKQV